VKDASHPGRFHSEPPISSTPTASGHRAPSEPPPAVAWHCLSPAGALEALNAQDAGLSEPEAARRLARHGPNVFRAAPRASPWTVLAAQLRSVLALLLIAAAAVAAATGDLADVVAIGAVLVLNVGIGFVTELRAHRAMEALLRLEVLRARVVREGRSRETDARELVPGDIILLEAGQTVPADARLLAAAELRTVEAALSGEPGSVAKRADASLAASVPLGDRRTMVYKTTGVVAGTARAVVVATGMATEVGRIGELAGRVVKDPTPLERRLDALGRRLAVVALVVAVLIAALGAWQGMPLGQMLQTAIALAVAAVPEGLPVVGTIAMAVGVRRMAHRRALIRHLPVVEALGSASVICTDKTGTLTAGQMTTTVLRLADREVAVSGAGWTPEGRFRVKGQVVDAAADATLSLALRIGALANAAELRTREGTWHPVGDPTDVAFLVVARKGGLDRDRLLAEWPEVRQVPFSSERMLMATVHRHDGGFVAYVKGAPRAVIERCVRIATPAGVRPLRPGEREELLGWSRDLAARGLRVLALATGAADEAPGDPADLTWVGFAGLSDPPAAGVRETIHAFRGAGIRTVMITGDHRLTAETIGRELGILHAGDEVLEGRDVERLSDAELDRVVPRVGAFGRASPEAKLRIIAAFQRRGDIVAMLGDGVNDAAALRKADIGVAMGGRGTDLAKEAADVILADDRFPTIGVAIEEGRVILENVRKFVIYLFSCNLAELLVLLGAGLAGYPAALAPLQILWLNLLTDTFPALALAVEPGEAGIMRRPPGDPRAAILPAAALRSAAGYAVLIALATLAAFAWGLGSGDLRVAGTLAFMTLAFAQIFHLGNARSSGPVLSPQLVLGNRFALGAAALAVALQLLAALLPPLCRVLRVTPLSASDWLVVGVLGLVPAVAGQTLKSLRRAPAA
jgi:Ca2+-transporting ATPase